MQAIKINSTAKTPSVVFNHKTGVLEITGNSTPENPFEMYQPLLKWIDEYLQMEPKRTEVRIFLEYFNTSSSKYLYEILKRFELAKGVVKIKWFYLREDEDIQMAGEEYKSMLRVNFEMIAVDESM